ncbi:hypothetical protein PCL1606_58330 [Pseudomonas chlororaphis]|uniref:Uncharacterized protein n=1 Tax=Pseudomonas chlororaphis TaxID=587753 RepID=A0A0D5Y7G7_9PSED|nr:hypothetical protein PCL1606_58330 [Pseudomonas chlororaphis]
MVRRILPPMPATPLFVAAVERQRGCDRPRSGRQARRHQSIRHTALSGFTGLRPDRSLAGARQRLQGYRATGRSRCLL